jgi:hypothetical protein
MVAAVAAIVLAFIYFSLCLNLPVVAGKQRRYVPQSGSAQSMSGQAERPPDACPGCAAGYLLLTTVHSKDEPVIVKPLPLQAFWPLQAFAALLQAL